jgi:hypothetical protein
MEASVEMSACLSLEQIRRVRSAIAAMRKADTGLAAQPSAAWQENLSWFSYLMEGDDLKPFAELRLHARHITGDPFRPPPRMTSVSHEPLLCRNRSFHPLDLLADLAHSLGILPRRAARTLFFRRWLRRTPIPKPIWDACGELDILGGDRIEPFRIGGRNHNYESGRFLAEILNLVEGGGLDWTKKGLRVMDIGSGWGGMALALRGLLADSHLALLDLPETFIFSIPYLLVARPDASFHIAGDAGVAPLGDPAGFETHDFSFYPPGAIERFPDKSFDLLLNAGSMAEMSEPHVLYYVRQIKRVGRGVFYSFNEDRLSRNKELRSLTNILQSEFSTTRGRHEIEPFFSLLCRW